MELHIHFAGADHTLFSISSLKQMHEADYLHLNVMERSLKWLGKTRCTIFVIVQTIPVRIDENQFGLAGQGCADEELSSADADIQHLRYRR